MTFAVELRLYPAHQGLAEVVEGYSVFEMGRPAGAAPALRALPSLAISLCLHYGGCVSATYRNKTQLVRSALTGFHTEPRSYAAAVPVGLVLVHFRTGCVGQFFRIDAGEVLDQNVDLSDLIPRAQLERIEDELGAATTDSARIERVEAFLNRLRANNRRDRLAQRAASIIRAQDGNVAIRALARDLAISPRQFERRFSREIGIGPKMFARLARFHCALREAPRARSLADLAQDAGYFDQSHLIRECREFSGAAASMLAEKRLIEAVSLH